MELYFLILQSCSSDSTLLGWIVPLVITAPQQFSNVFMCFGIQKKNNLFKNSGERKAMCLIPGLKLTTCVNLDKLYPNIFWPPFFPPL